MRALSTLGDDTRKRNGLTLTPEPLLTPDALHKAGEEVLEAEEKLEEVVVDWACPEATE